MRSYLIKFNLPTNISFWSRSSSSPKTTVLVSGSILVTNTGRPKAISRPLRCPMAKLFYSKDLVANPTIHNSDLLFHQQLYLLHICHYHVDGSLHNDLLQ